jgi:hypothetical protein
VDSDTLVEVPTDEAGLSLFFVQLFEDGSGPLASLKITNLVQQTSEVAGAVAAALGTLAFDAVAGAVRPCLANLCRSDLLASLATAAAPFTRPLADAVELFGRITMADFGGDGEDNVIVNDGLANLAEVDDVDQLAAKLQEVAATAVEQGGGKVDAARLLACGIVGQNLRDLPALFLLAVSWSSNSSLAAFANAGVYLHAFDLIIALLAHFS